MKKLQKLTVLFLSAVLVFGVIGCEEDKGNDGVIPGGQNNGGQNQGGNEGGNNDGSNGNGSSSDIDWNSEADGTLTVINNTAKDMIIFQGQTPSASNILGGVKGLSTRVFDVSDDVDDFAVGGYMILRGITLDEYEVNKTNLTKARIEYSAMATYKQGKKFRVEISPSYTGDYGYQVNNLGRIGMELRKNSPDGEKIGYLPSLATKELLYSDTTNQLTLFPVYVWYTRSTGQITTLHATSHFESVTVNPRPLTDATLPVREFPNDPTVTWESIVKSLVSPVAYVTVTNNVPNQGATFTLAAGSAVKAQNGYDGIESGEQLTFEMLSTADGTQKNIVITYYNGSIKVPVKFDGESGYPLIKNGYDYTITVNFAGGSVSDNDNYSATITESAKPRDMSSDIATL